MSREPEQTARGQGLGRTEWPEDQQTVESDHSEPASNASGTIFPTLQKGRNGGWQG